MRILHISDFHFREAWFAWLASRAPVCDLICHTGDFLDPGSGVPGSDQIRQMRRWLAPVRKRLFFCSGNHDGGWLQGLPSVHQRGDEAVLNYRGVTLLASRWGTPCRPPCPVNVLLRHAPPAGCATAISKADHQDLGDFEVGEDWRAGMLGADLILSGHQHAPLRWYDRCGTSLSFNPGCRLHQPMPNSILIDLFRRRAIWWVNGQPAHGCHW